MIHAGERAQAPGYRNRLSAQARLTFALLRDEASVGSPVLVRVGFVVFALLLQTLVINSPGHFRPAPNTFFAILVPLGTAGSLAALFWATLPLTRRAGRRYRRSIATVGLTTLGVLAIAGLWHAVPAAWSMTRSAPPGNDGAVMDLYAAKQTLQGHDPYLKTNIVTALASIDAAATTVTPIREGQFRGVQAYPSDASITQVFLNVLRYRSKQGVPIPPEFESKYNYPAGSFLIILPFVWAGIHDMRFLYALALILMGVYLWKRMPRSLRLLVPGIILADTPVLMHLEGGQPDPLYALFLMIGYAEWRSPWLSPLAFGVALGTKQLAWFFAPFYLLLIIRHFGWRDALRRAGVMAGVFLLLNGPFIAQSPSAYLSSIAGPMSDPMFPLGIGVVAIFIGNAVPMAPKIAFTVAEGVAWLASSAAFWRLRFLTPASGVVLAAVPLFFAWRSLVNYFYLLPLLVLAVILADMHRQNLDPVRT